MGWSMRAWKALLHRRMAHWSAESAQIPLEALGRSGAKCSAVVRQSIVPQGVVLPHAILRELSLNFLPGGVTYTVEGGC